MATSKCGACGKTHFELVPATPNGCRYQVNFVQCSACGVVIGVTGHSDVATLVGSVSDQLEKAKNAIEGRLARIEAALPGRR
jgi:hypothetical protein